jgi:nucleotide-binding universal stress UspA family protein
MRTILVGDDETDGSKRALDRAVELAHARAYPEEQGIEAE